MRARGFTLIEMLVVLLIIGVAMTVVPSLLSSLPGARLRAAADGMAGTLTALRAQAMASGRGTALVVDPASRSYAILPDGARRVLPDVVNAVDVTTTAVPIVGGHAGLFRFFPDGTATGGTIRLRHGERDQAIAVDWLTGRVRRFD
jgi:general secretion pathway protein H